MTDGLRAPPPFCLLVAALGGEGGGVLADWLVECARSAGLPVQATSVPGVAQRTGSTSYYLEMRREPLAPGEPVPVFALSPVPGCVDVVVASELLEAARTIERGFVTPERTTLIASTHRVYTTIEKMHMADGRHDSARIVDSAGRLAARLALLDMDAVATRAGTAISAVMFGALAGAGVLPWSRAVCEAVIGASARGAKASLAGFALAFDAVASPRAHAAIAAHVDTALSDAEATAAGARLIFADARVPESVHRRWIERLAGWSPALALIVAHGAVRCRDYQNASVGDDYLERVATLVACLPANDATIAIGAHDEVLCEAARHLALWTCFEDVVRVADLKSRRGRLDRVRNEAQAKSADLVRVIEYFKPGVDEIAAILPAALGARLLATATRRGWLHAGIGLRIRSTSLWGHLMLRGLAALRPLRPHSLRHRQEHAAINAWLDAMRRLLPAAPTFARVLAGLPQVLKGYGDTQRRGRENYARLWNEQVAPMIAAVDASPGPVADAAGTTAAFARAVRATLADPEGELNLASTTTSGSKRIFWATPVPSVHPHKNQPAGDTP